MAYDMTDGRPAFVSTIPAGSADRRLAFAVVLVSVAIFVALVPFAKAPLEKVWPFIPIYQSALALSDVVTAILLLGQFRFLRSRALLILAGGYLFTAIMAALHMLTFPGLFGPAGLLGAGPQTTAWMFMFWHAGFPVCVVSYALVKNTRADVTSRPRVAMAEGVVAVVAAATGVTVLATTGQGALPAIMQGNQYTGAMLGVVSSTWAFSLLALMAVWRRRPHSVLDVWLMVVMCAWMFDIALAAVLNGGRFDLGFYAGRIYGFLASTFVLVVLLFENARLYARLIDAQAALQAQNRSLDETVRERTEQLLQSEKVATMGSLLAGVAHELNNPLAVVLAQAHMLRESAATSPESIGSRTEKITIAAGRCVRIVRNFLALARKRPPERTDVLLNDLIDQTLELVAYELKTESIDVTKTLDADLPRLSADAHQLQQVLVNLLTNAQHAMRKNTRPKRLTLATRFDAARQRIQIEISDTGPGIPRELQAKVFEPFFTTKPAGQGTGLGLSLCRNLVEQHGGTLSLKSEPGAGATFVIELAPATEASRPVVPAVAEPGPGTPKRILVVDDEMEIAGVVAEMLRGEGHTTEVVGNGHAALHALARAPFDLILSDTKMPVLDGLAFYRQLEQSFPQLKGRIIFVTGDVLDEEKQHFLAATGAPVLTKPFLLSDLRTTVRRRLASLEAQPA
jgi:signal transduction histidine kinase